MNYKRGKVSVRRFVRFNWLSFIILAGLLLFGLGKWQLNKAQSDIDRIIVVRESDGALTLSGGDGPFVITHLVYKHSYVAQLSTPVVMLESGRTYLSSDVVNKLTWHDPRGGEEVENPPKNAPLTTLYYKAQQTEFSRSAP